MNDPLISFCTTCKGRLYALKETLQQNLTDNPGADVEFVILDYNSDDGLAEWIEENFQNVIRNGRLQYYASRGQPWFHMAHAKNCVHRLARGKWVCNLDADNFTGPGFAKYLKEQFRIHRLLHIAYQSANGRVALSAIDFQALGGYDESFPGYGWDDNDLKARAESSGLSSYQIPSDSPYTRSLDDTLHKRKEHYPPSLHDIISSNEINKSCSESNVAAGRLVANAGKRWGSIIVRHNFQDYITL